jgi:hypothetical protein
VEVDNSSKGIIEWRNTITRCILDILYNKKTDATKDFVSPKALWTEVTKEIETTKLILIL